MTYAVEEIFGVDDDLVEHYRAIVLGGQPQSAERLMDAYDALLHQLAMYPFSGHPVSTEVAALQRLRAVTLGSPFRSHVVYHWVDEPRHAVRILAVLHGSMGDQSRLRKLMQRASGET